MDGKSEDVKGAIIPRIEGRRDPFSLKMKGAKRRKRLKHGLYSHISSFRLDGRTRQGKQLNHLIMELTNHLGGPGAVSVTQALLIDTLASKFMRRKMYTYRIFKGMDKTDHNYLIAIENSIRLDCLALGLHKTKMPPIDLQEYLRRKDAELNKPIKGDTEDAGDRED